MLANRPKHGSGRQNAYSWNYDSDQSKPTYFSEMDVVSPPANSVAVRKASHEKSYRRRTRPRRGVNPDEHIGAEDPPISVLSYLYEAFESFTDNLQRVFDEIVSALPDDGRRTPSVKNAGGVSQETLNEEMRQLSLPKFDSPKVTLAGSTSATSLDRPSSDDLGSRLKALLLRPRSGDSKAVAEDSSQEYNPAQTLKPAENTSPSSAVSGPNASIRSGMLSIDSGQLPSLTTENLDLVNGGLSDAKVRDTAVAEADDSGNDSLLPLDDNGAVGGVDDDTASVVSTDSIDSVRSNASRT